MQRLRAARLILQLTLAVMLLGALAPTVSRALAAARNGVAPLLDICSTQAAAEPNPAASLVLAAPAPAPVSADPRGNGSSLALDHCPFCLLVADRLGPPPAAPMHFFEADSGLARPDEQAFFFQTLSLSSALPRGPPTFSRARSPIA